MNAEARWLVDPYEGWVNREGVHVVAGLSVDLATAQTQPWPRLDCDGALIQLAGRGDYCDMHLIDLAPAGSTSPQRHLYECVVYVIDGYGNTMIHTPEGQISFEWGRGSLFAIPLNASYRHFNGSGTQRTRIVQVTDLPLTLKIFRDEQFIFDNRHEFVNRFGREGSFHGAGELSPVLETRSIWDTNLVANLDTFDKMVECTPRGRGSLNIQFVLAEGTLHSHMSEVPSGDYKKAHRHGAGAHIIQLGGAGYSTYWYDSEPVETIQWSYALAHAPSDAMWHQHFNVGREPARYIAMSFGNIRYPITEKRAASWRRGGITEIDQIEYEDEDPSVRVGFEAAQAAHGE